MANPIKIKRRFADATAPTTADLVRGEQAYNEVSDTLYIALGESGGNPTEVKAVGGSGAFVSKTESQTQNTVFAAPNGSNGAPTFRVIVKADIPTFDTEVRTSRLDQMAAPTGSVSLNSQKITNLGTPTSPNDATNKAYVDGVIQGLKIKPTARLATANATALPSNTYSNGTLGVGATLTATANGALSVDGQTVVAGDLVLVKSESASANNGLYTVTTVGDGSNPYVLTRDVDMDSATEFSGAFVPVGSAGATNANSLWLANPSGTVTVGTTSIPFTQLNAATSTTASNGILKTGNNFTLDIDGLTDLGAGADVGDEVALYDVSGTVTKKVTVSELVANVTIDGGTY